MHFRASDVVPMPTQRWVMSSRHTLVLDRPRLLAILNITPDSFSDAGLHAAPDDAARAAATFVEEGADALDLGAESTRPGAAAVSAAEQLRRVLPAIDAVRRAVGDAVPITIDTTDAEVARAAFDHGADAVNDVSGASADERMLPLVASRRAGIILMHRRVPASQDSYSHAYAQAPEYGPGGVVPSVRDYLRSRADAALAAGVAHDHMVIDPGLGFGKSVEQNMELLESTGEFVALGYPVLSALSRKSFTARIAGISTELPPTARVAATVALSAAHLARGARIFRVHDVREHARALAEAWTALCAARPQ
jgi:dihydropteroate synthase